MFVGNLSVTLEIRKCDEQKMQLGKEMVFQTQFLIRNKK
jgi:hypothetical protein